MTMKHIVAAVAAAITLWGAVSTDANAQRRRNDWVLLGEQRVGFKVDRDAITISHAEDWYRTRSFRSLQFVAEGNEGLQ